MENFQVILSLVPIKIAKVLSSVFCLLLLKKFLQNFLSSNEQIVTSNKQKVTSNEQKVMSGKFHLDVLILVRSVFEDDYIFYPQVFLEECLHKLS